MKKQEKIPEESVEHFLTVIDCFCHDGFDNNWDKQSFKKAVEYTKEWVKYRLPKKTTMKNLHDIIQKNMDTFEKTFPSIKDVAEEVGDTYGFPIYIQLKDFFLSSQLSIIQAIDEWVEKNKKEEPKKCACRGDRLRCQWHTQYIGHNSALSELRSFLNTKTKLQ